MVDKSEYYSASQAAKHAGYDSTYMLDYLCKEGLIEPIVMNGKARGRGRRRLFTFQQLVVLRLYRKLFDEGISVKGLKQAFHESNDFRELKVTRDGIRVGRSAVDTFYARDKNIFIRTATDQFIQAASGGQFVFSFMVNLKDLHEEVAANTKNIIHLKRRENGQGFRPCQVVEVGTK